jgi:predicted nucleic acid-binding protein
MIIVSDTSPITSLAAINKLKLLQQLYGSIIIPEAVYRELTEVSVPVPGTREVLSADWIQMRSVVNRSLVANLKALPLDEGESEAIVLAKELNAEILLIDERRGRAEASRQGLRITGLLGVLIEAKTQGAIAEIKPIIDELILTAEFRVSQMLYDRVLQIVGE